MHGHSQAHIFHQEDLRGPLVTMVIATFSMEKGENTGSFCLGDKEERMHNNRKEDFN